VQASISVVTRYSALAPDRKRHDAILSCIAPSGPFEAARSLASTTCLFIGAPCRSPLPLRRVTSRVDVCEAAALLKAWVNENYVRAQTKEELDQNVDVADTKETWTNRLEDLYRDCTGRSGDEILQSLGRVAFAQVLKVAFPGAFKKGLTGEDGCLFRGFLAPSDPGRTWTPVTGVEGIGPFKIDVGTLRVTYALKNEKNQIGRYRSAVRGDTIGFEIPQDPPKWLTEWRLAHQAAVSKAMKGANFVPSDWRLAHEAPVGRSAMLNAKFAPSDWVLSPAALEAGKKPWPIANYFGPPVQKELDAVAKLRKLAVEGLEGRPPWPLDKDTHETRGVHPRMEGALEWGRLVPLYMLPKPPPPPPPPPGEEEGGSGGG
jgi:hypothetical protein